MDQRQAQIRERAGLEESRLNQEFLDFLRKYSTPVLLLAALAALGFLGWQRWQKMQIAKVDKAFDEYNQMIAPGNPSPESLKSIAADHEGVGAVPLLARLRAADEYLEALQTGTKVGAAPTQDGKVKPEEVMTDEDRKAYLAEAESLYAQVEADCAGNAARMPMRVGAIFGLAAIAESKGDLPAAKAHYERIAELTKGTAFDRYARTAEARIATLDDLKSVPRVFGEAELPKLPDPPASPTPAPQPAAAPITLEPVTGPPATPPTPATPTTPAPQPKP